jgi:hypothetical protein
MDTTMLQKVGDGGSNFDSMAEVKIPIIFAGS